MSEKENKELSMWEAFVKAQSEIKIAVLNKTNPHFKSKFADLKSVFDSCKKALNDNGFAISQPICFEGGNVHIKTELIYKTGERIESSFPLSMVGNIQQIGSQITYIRRYSLSSILGIVADEDDDANSTCPLTITEREIKTLEGLIDTLPAHFKNKLLANAKVERLEDIKQSDLPKIVNWLNANIRKEGVKNV